MKTAVAIATAVFSCKYGDKSIEEVANGVGYSDTRTYRKHFKEFFGMTPLKFRKKYSSPKGGI